MHPFQSNSADIERLLDHAYIRRKVGSRGVLIFSHKAGNLLANIVMIGEAFFPRDVSGSVFQPAFE
jgi:hypothetical protein